VRCQRRRWVRERAGNLVFIGNLGGFAGKMTDDVRLVAVDQRITQMSRISKQSWAWFPLSRRDWGDLVIR